MKKIVAGITAILMVCGTLTACGKTEGKSKSDESNVTSSIADKTSGNKEASDKADEVSNEKKSSSDNESSDNYESETPETSYDEQAMIELIEQEVQFAIDNNFDEFKNVTSKEFWKNVFEAEDGKPVSDSEVEDFINDDIYDGFVTLSNTVKECEISSPEIKDLKVENSETSPNGDLTYMEVTFNVMGNKDNANVEVLMAYYDNYYGMSVEKCSSETMQKLATANANAKSIEVAVFGAIENMKTQGKTISPETHNFKINEYNPDDEIEVAVYNALGSDENSGYVYFSIQKSDIYNKYTIFTQWKEEENSDIIGQCPNAPTNTSQKLTWGQNN